MSPEQSSNTITSGRHRRAVASMLLLAVASSSPTTTSAFSPINNNNNNNIQQKISRSPYAHHTGRGNAAAVRLSLQTDENNQSETNNKNNNNNLLSTTAAASLLALAITTTPLLSLSPQPAFAYEESDYASETVTNVVAQLKSTAGDASATFATLEDLGKIITEGKGVGGTLTYDGVRLNEGFVADEDTTIYNPGLTLLTSSEKERLVDAIIQNRKVGLSSGGTTDSWSEDNEYAFDFLKQKLDPLHMHELEGYLGILPFYGAALYIGAIFAQKNTRAIFPLVYGLCALGVFGPVFLLVVTGP